MAVVDRVREVVGVRRAAPALFTLPGGGRLLVGSDAGVWVVDQDGSKRLLAGYREASWSPFGRFVVATKRNELAALEPDGDVRWTIARPGVRFARWGGTATDTRIAYLSSHELRVVAGDGTDDHRVARRVADVSPVWRTGAAHVLTYVGGDGFARVHGERLEEAPAVIQVDWVADRRLVLPSAGYPRCCSESPRFRRPLVRS